MAEERTFVYGFRSSHCIRAIAMFGAAAMLDAWWVMGAGTTVGRAIPAVIGGFFLFMVFQMTRLLVARKTGKRKIVVGGRTLVAPTGVFSSQPDVELAYRDMRDVVAAGGQNGKLQIKHPAGTLEIDRLMLANDGEFDELVGAIRKRVKEVKG